MKAALIILILIISIPAAIAEIEACTFSKISCESCRVYNTNKNKLTCAPESSNIIKDPKLNLEQVNDKTVRIMLEEGGESAVLTLTTLKDEGIEKPKLDVNLDVKRIAKIPYYIDTEFTGWNNYILLINLFGILIVVSLILKDLSSPGKRKSHNKRHLQSMNKF